MAVTVSKYADEVIKMIEYDIKAGIVPWDVADVSELHDFVDANDYFAGIPERMYNPVADEVNLRLSGSYTEHPSWNRPRRQYSVRRAYGWYDNPSEVDAYAETMGAFK